MSRTKWRWSYHRHKLESGKALPPSWLNTPSSAPCTSLARANTAAEGAPSRTSVNKVLPVFMTGIKGMVGLSCKLCAAIPLRSNCALKLLARVLATMHVACLSMNEHHTVTYWLKSNNLQFHTFSLGRPKATALVLHGLDTDSDLQAVMDELQELRFPVVAAARLHSTVGPRCPLPLIQLLVKKGKKLELLNLKGLFGLVIQDKLCCKTKKVLQSHRFGHNSHTCHNKPACVHCGCPTPHAVLHASLQCSPLLH